MSLQILEDLVDTASVETVSALFDYLERVMPELQQHENGYFNNFRQPADGAKLTLLRIGNQVRVHTNRCSSQPPLLPSAAGWGR